MNEHFLSILERKLSVRLRRIASSRDNLVFVDEAKSKIIRLSLNKTLDSIKSEMKLIDFLDGVGCKVAKIIDFFDVEQKPCVVFRYIPHSDTVIAASSAVLAANELHKLHTKATGFLANNTFAADRTFTTEIEKFLAAAQNGDFRNADNIDQVVRDMEWAKQFIANSNPENPPTVLHNDLRPNNVLFEDNRLAAIIDFDYAFAAPFPEKDVAHSALVWSFPDGADQPNINIFNAFIESYAKNLGLSLTEYVRRYNLVDWVKVSAIMDTAMYFTSPNFDKNTERLRSYMYSKFLWFKDKYDK